MESPISILLKINDEIMAAGGFDGKIRFYSSSQNFNSIGILEAHT
jgi:hypothetical protein